MTSEMQKASEKRSKSRGKFLGLSSSILWALLFTALIGVWAITGEIKGGSSTKAVGETAKEEKTKQEAVQTALFRVRTTILREQNYLDKLIIRGRTFSDNQVEVKAEIAGNVLKLPVEKGQIVEVGALLCQLEDGARSSDVLEARATVAQTKADYEASKKLVRRGHTAGLKVLQNKALYDRAKASLARAELALERTKIKAPFRGVIETLPGKVGSHLSVGQTCAKLVALDPLHVIGAVKERDIPKIHPGMSAVAKLVTGETVKGKVKFIASTADEATRTFRMEVIIPNKDNRLRSGVTSDIEISLPERRAMLLPPSLLVLNDEGVVGVRLVTGERKVFFKPVRILSEQKEGIWIDALPDASTVITVGQDFVKEGQIVSPVDDPKFKEQPGS